MDKIHQQGYDSVLVKRSGSFVVEDLTPPSRAQIFLSALREVNVYKGRFQ